MHIYKADIEVITGADAYTYRIVDFTTKQLTEEGTRKSIEDIRALADFRFGRQGYVLALPEVFL